MFGSFEIVISVIIALVVALLIKMFVDTFTKDKTSKKTIDCSYDVTNPINGGRSNSQQYIDDDGHMWYRMN